MYQWTMWSGALAMNSANRHIVITGFMGTGKTTTGRVLAEKLNRPFVDMDDLIIERAGKSIPKIFAEDGEPVFRTLERDILQELAQTGGQVIATGGGALVADANRQLMKGATFLVCLTAVPEVIESRLSRDGAGRPLAQGWRELLDKRASAYADIPIQIDTSNRQPQQVAEEIIRLWQSSL